MGDELSHGLFRHLRPLGQHADPRPVVVEELEHAPVRDADLRMLRSLDAIHLATASSISAELGVLIIYDRRMLTEAQTLGLPVLSPR